MCAWCTQFCCRHPLAGFCAVDLQTMAAAWGHPPPCLRAPVLLTQLHLRDSLWRPAQGQVQEVSVQFSVRGRVGKQPWLMIRSPRTQPGQVPSHQPRGEQDAEAKGVRCAGRRGYLRTFCRWWGMLHCTSGLRCCIVSEHMRKLRFNRCPFPCVPHAMYQVHGAASTVCTRA